MSELTIKDIEKILEQVWCGALDAKEMKREFQAVSDYETAYIKYKTNVKSTAVSNIMQLIDSAITEAVTKELTERSEDIEQIIDATYKIGRTDEAMQINDYKTLKPGILKKVQALIDSAITEARIDEVDRIPNGAYINPTTGKRVNYNQEYKINRLAQLKDNTSVEPPHKHDDFCLNYGKCSE